MPSFDDRPRSVFRSLPELNQVTTDPVSSAAERARVSTPMSAGGLPEPEPVTVTSAPLSPLSTRQLPALSKVTRQLTAISEPGTQRLPLVIKGETKKLALVPAPVAVPPAEQKKRRAFVNLVGMALLLLVILLTFLTATPLGQEVGLSFNPLQFGGNLFNNQDSNPYNLVAQATATAIYHQRSDGYDPYIHGGQLVSDGLHSLNWPVGQCTYWANLRYQQLVGYWIPWNGNADQWVEGARLAGWHVSQSPHVPSVIVLMPGVQGASGYGHVAVVEGVDGNTVHTSNMNWYSNGGGFNRVSTVDFNTGSGVYFVWHT